MNSEYLSWNRLPRVAAKSYHSLSEAKLPNSPDYPLLVRGNGRSYGDVCLNARGSLCLTNTLDKLIAFDGEKGILRAQAGLLLRDILAFIVPQGWFLSATPGTSLISLGGAVANDVHGKNHHVAGSFGHHVRSLTLIRSDGETLSCSADSNADLFYATIGGLGLTGFIADVEIQLLRIHNPLMWCQNRPFYNLDEYWALNAETQALWPSSASWIDCLSGGNKLGRGVMFLGKHAAANAQPFIGAKKPLSVPLEPPFSLINKTSLWGFNELYFHTHKAEKSFFSDYRPFFYPLDSIGNWNRIYGRRGFYQYQCVLPPQSERDGIRELLKTIRHSGQGSFLAVLKSFGNMPSLGLLSFPRAGTTLALDFPNRGDKTLKLFERLDAVVSECGGALYAGKDARMSPAMFAQSNPRLAEFTPHIDSQFSSHFWERVTK